jgi:HD superfamily phosphohydrolase YqeK
MKKIVIKTCPTADFRTCDPARVAREDLLRSSALHKRDVQELMMALSRKLVTAGVMHDIDKVLDLDTFYANFRTNFEQDDWLQRHYRSTRHHLNQDEYVQ